MEILNQLKTDQNGLIPAIIQDDENKEVLMVGYMNREAVRKTLESGRVCFWSRSRQEYWIKGETSGHTQTVRTVAFDCDADALLIKVEQKGGHATPATAPASFGKSPPMATPRASLVKRFLTQMQYTDSFKETSMYYPNLEIFEKKHNTET